MEDISNVRTIEHLHDVANLLQLQSFLSGDYSGFYSLMWSVEELTLIILQRKLAKYCVVVK